MTTVVNLFGGPGAGKSTMAAGLFFNLKNYGLKVELVNEYAKELAYEGTLSNTSQDFILSQQKRRLDRLIGKVDWIITDSPLLLSIIYYSGLGALSFKRYVHASFSSFNNINYFITRTKKYHKYGRGQTESEAVDLCSKIKLMLEQDEVSHTTVPGNISGLSTITKHIISTKGTPTT